MLILGKEGYYNQPVTVLLPITQYISYSHYFKVMMIVYQIQNNFGKNYFLNKKQ